MTILEDIREFCDVMPKATKGEAMAAALELSEKLTKGEIDAFYSAAEIMAAAATCDDPGLLRSILVFVNDNGPIVHRALYPCSK